MRARVSGRRSERGIVGTLGLAYGLTRNLAPMHSLADIEVIVDAHAYERIESGVAKRFPPRVVRR